MSENTNSQVDPQEAVQPSAPVENNGKTEPGAIAEEQAMPHEPKSGLGEEPLTEAERLKKEYRNGLTLGLVSNGIAGCLYVFYMGAYSFHGSWRWGDGVWEFGILWFAVNILILAPLALWKKKIFEGLVAGLALAFLIVFVIGAILTGVCYGAI